MDFLMPKSNEKRDWIFPCGIISGAK